jgi:hypothetical protein
LTIYLWLQIVITVTYIILFDFIVLLIVVVTDAKLIEDTTDSLVAMCRLAIPILPSTTLTRVLVNLGEQAIEPEDKQPKLFIRHTLFEVADHALLGLKLV